MAKYPNQASLEEILQRAALAQLAGRKVAFWGWDPTVFVALQQSGTLRGTNFCIVSEKEGEHVLRVLDRSVQPPDYLVTFQPEEIIILAKEQAIAVYERLVREMNYPANQVFMPESAWNTRLFVSDPLYEMCLGSVPKHLAGGLSTSEVSVHLFDSLKYITEHDVPGSIVNLGVFQGWSMYFIGLFLEQVHQEHRRIVGFDTFEGFVQTGSAHDSFCEFQCSLGKTGWNFFKNTSLEGVAQALAGFSNMVLVKGDIRSTVSRLQEETIALALFDMDDYYPTTSSLSTVYERLSRRGVIVHDHFSYPTLCGGACTGQRLAMLEFLEKHHMFHLTGTNVFLKI